MFKLITFIFIVHLFNCVICRENDFYTVLIPGKLRPNSEHLITISIHAPKTEVSLQLVNRDEAEKKVNYNLETVTIDTNTTRIVPVKIGQLEKTGEYKLIVNGSGGINFTHHVNLNLDSLHKLAFIQTDKAIYKAGQKVNFRVFIVDQELRPLSNIQTTTIIKDAKENIILSLKNTTLKNGIVTGDFQLTSQPLLGNWKIIVKSDDFNEEKSFIVDEYVPPNFGVDIKFPTLVTKSTTSFFITVESKYTYGKPVKGELTLKIGESHFSYYRYAENKNRKVEYLTDINGIAHVNVETKDFIDVNNFYDAKEYSVTASVRDYLTDKTYNKTAILKVYNDKYKFTFLETSRARQFVSGFNYSTAIKVTYPNDEPIDFDDQVKITYGFGYGDGKKREIIAKPVRGIIRLNLDTTPFEPEPTVISTKNNGTRKTIYLPQTDDSSTIKVEVEFKGHKYLIGFVYKSSRATECYASLRLKNNLEEPKFKIGDQVEFVLDSLFPIKEFVYHFVNKRGTTQSEIVKDSNEFKINLTEDSSPKSRVLVHFNCNGSLTSDGFDFNVEGIVKNNVNLKVDKNSTSPGKPINIEIESEPHSVVTLLGIDKKILLLKTGNDVSREDLVKGIERYVGCKGTNYFESCSTGENNYWLEQPTPWEIRSSGFILLSNKHNIPKPAMMPVPIVAFSDPGLRGAARPMAVAFSTEEPMFDKAEDRYESSQLMKKNKVKIDEIQIRKHFPETFIWDIVETDDKGQALFTKNVPDSITSYQISSIGVGSKLGLSNPSEFSVLIPFFISPSLPYFIIRDEIVSIEVTVYNYLETPQETEVTLFNENDDFEFINGSTSNEQVGKDHLKKKTKQITVPSNGGMTTNFLIKPKKVGNVVIDISAAGQTVGDRVNKQLLVRPEGETIYKSKPFMIIADKSESKKVLTIDFPEDIVPDSEYVSVNIVGDILGQQMNSLESLIRIPYGCGEQNMVNFVPNIVVLDYLTKLKRLTPKIEAKTKGNMLNGYQRELTYKLDDGSYSAFGKADKDGSTFLTAFVTKSFEQAKPYIEIDRNVVNKGFDFLRSKQNNDGSFREDGRTFSRSLKGGVAGETGALSAYVLISLVSSLNTKERDDMVNKTERYLAKRIETTKNGYEIAIITYALHLIDSSKKDDAFNKLEEIKKVDGEHVYWTQNTSNHHESTIEMTSYALMVYVLRNKIDDGLPILRYLISKQNSKGGFYSTQDTVIGIEAMAKFASSFNFTQGEIDLNIRTNLEQTFGAKVANDNALVLQQIILDKKTRQLTISASGTGTAYVGLAYQYNILNSEKKPSFTLRHEYSETNSAVNINVCTKYLEGNESGMAILEANLPSGVTADLETFDEMKKSLVKRVETKNSDTVIVVYFDKITNEELCIQFIGNKVNKIANSKQMPLVVYDYYDSSKRMTSFYQPIQHSTCELCEEADCDPSCQP